MYMAIGQCGSVLGSHLYPKTEGPRYVYASLRSHIGYFMKKFCSRRDRFNVQQEGLRCHLRTAVSRGASGGRPYGQLPPREQAAGQAVREARAGRDCRHARARGQGMSLAVVEKASSRLIEGSACRLLISVTCRDGLQVYEYWREQIFVE